MEIINSVGIEIELENTHCSSELAELANSCGFSTDNDASVRSNMKTFLGKTAYKDKDSYMFDTLVDDGGAKDFGIELITKGTINPDSESFARNLERLCYYIQDEGLESPRASLHVHINVSKDVNLLNLKSMLRWATRTEAMFYRLGSLGRDHRGIYNQYNYCRPITKNGPTIIRGREGYVRVFNISDLVKADTLQNFWEMYGDSNNNPNHKYHPVRYHWINLYSILKRGSLEFRVFNLTTNPYEIRAMILLCQATTNLMLKTNYKDLQELGVRPQNSIFDPDAEDSQNILEYILDSYEIKYPSLKYRILDIYSKSSFPPAENENVFSHMVEKEDRRYFVETPYAPETIPSHLIKKSKYVDIHNIRNNGEIVNVPTHIHKLLK